MINLDNYEDVNSRVKRFREAHISGRIETFIVEHDLAAGYVLVKCCIYREHEDQVPAASDFAYGNVAFYRENMKRWFIEDTCTSAIGRAIGLLMPSENKATRENMQQVVNAPASADVWATPLEPVGTVEPFSTGVEAARQALGGVMPPEPPYCDHGHMLWKEGKSAKTGNAYKGWVCASKTKPQCAPRWEQVNG
jgi:hypothetical protein